MKPRKNVKKLTDDEVNQLYRQVIKKNKRLRKKELYLAALKAAAKNNKAYAKKAKDGFRASDLKTERAGYYVGKLYEKFNIFKRNRTSPLRMILDDINDKRYFSKQIGEKFQELIDSLVDLASRNQTVKQLCFTKLNVGSLEKLRKKLNILTKVEVTKKERKIRSNLLKDVNALIENLDSGEVEIRNYEIGTRKWRNAAYKYCFEDWVLNRSWLN